MTGTSYVPGTWLGIVRGCTAVILGPDSPPALAGAVWDLLGTGPEVHEVLHAVTSSSGGSLAQIPSFGILEATGPLRVFLRGDLDLAVELPDGRVELDGRDVTTWNERRFALPGACRLAIPAAGSAGQQELPLGEGVVLLQSLAFVLAPRQPELGPSGAAPASVVVDSAGIADVRDAAPDADASAEMTIVPDRAASVETVAPEHGASAETVVGVLDDDLLADDGDQQDQDGDLEQEDGNAHVAVTGSGPDSGADSDSHGASADGSAPSEIISSEVRQADVHPAEPAPGEPVPPASDHTGSYDHLWERTVVRSIEDAAVRDDAEAEIDGTPDGEEPADPPVNAQPDGQELPTPAPMPAAGPPAAPASPLPLASQVPAASPAPAGGLIDSVPWKKGADAAVQGSAPQIHVPQANVPQTGAGPRAVVAAPAAAAAGAGLAAGLQDHARQVAGPQARKLCSDGRVGGGVAQAGLPHPVHGHLHRLVLGAGLPGHARSRHAGRAEGVEPRGQAGVGLALVQDLQQAPIRSAHLHPCGKARHPCWRADIHPQRAETLGVDHRHLHRLAGLHLHLGGRLREGVARGGCRWAQGVQARLQTQHGRALHPPPVPPRPPHLHRRCETLARRAHAEPQAKPARGRPVGHPHPLGLARCHRHLPPLRLHPGPVGVAIRGLHRPAHHPVGPRGQALEPH
ncbi:MAG: hypothetical protein ACK4K6_12455, partial [Pseudarthrobacter sp.]